MFDQNYRLYFFDQGGHREELSCREGFNGRIVDLCSLHQILEGPSFPGSATFSSLRFQTCISQPLQIGIPPS